MDHATTLIARTRTARFTRRQFAIGATAGITLTTLRGRAILAQDASPAVEPTLADGVELTVLAGGLEAPRFVAVDGDTVYVTESGTGGDEAYFGTPEPGTPAAADPLGSRGNTGRLVAVSADGTVTPIVDDFISYRLGESEFLGPAGIGLDGAGFAYVAVSAPGPQVGFIELTGTENAVYKVDLATGESTLVANVGEYELANNPDPNAIDSNLFGAAYHDGAFYVADAGGNAIYTVDVETGEVSPLDVTGGLEVEIFGEAGNPLRGGAPEIDSVPGAVAVDAEGNVYLSFVTGGPFPVGGAPIYRYGADGVREVYATGLTMTAGLAFASDGTLYASILSADMVNGAPGQIVRVSTDGNHEVIVDGLLTPAGIAFGADDTLYVASKTNGFQGAGELLKITGVTTATGVPVGTPAS